MIVTLVPFGALTGLVAFNAVGNWIIRIQGQDPMPDFGDTVWLTVFAALMLFLLVLWLIVGTVRVREQLSAEAGRASTHEDDGAGAA